MDAGPRVHHLFLQVLGSTVRGIAEVGTVTVRRLEVEHHLPVVLRPRNLEEVDARRDVEHVHEPLHGPVIAVAEALRPTAVVAAEPAATGELIDKRQQVLHPLPRVRLVVIQRQCRIRHRRRAVRDRVTVTRI